VRPTALLWLNAALMTLLCSGCVEDHYGAPRHYGRRLPVYYGSPAVETVYYQPTTSYRRSYRETPPPIYSHGYTTHQRPYCPPPPTQVRLQYTSDDSKYRGDDNKKKRKHQH